MRWSRSTLVVSLLFTAACGEERFNPCPRVMVPEGDTCVDEAASTGSDAAMLACPDAEDIPTEVEASLPVRDDGGPMRPPDAGGIDADAVSEPQRDASVGAPDATTPRDAALDGGGTL